MRKEIIQGPDVKNIIDYDMKIWSQKYTFMIFMVLVVIYFSYQTGIFKTIPCGNDMVNGITRNFIHINTKHLLANLAGIYILYRAEVQLGPEKFLKTFISILIMSVVFECLCSKIFNTNCSIGFSGILFGFAAWSLFTEKDMDYPLLGFIIGFIVLSSIKDNNVSFVGHASGFVAGLVVALFMGNVEKRDVSALIV